MVAVFRYYWVNITQEVQSEGRMNAFEGLLDPLTLNSCSLNL